MSEPLSDGLVEPNLDAEWDGHEPLPLDVISDSEPDPEWEIVAVEDAGIDAELPGEVVAVVERQDVNGQDTNRELSLPVHSTRSDAPGPRGCWALNKHGEPCGAGKLRDGDYCAAHSGVGLSSDPAAYAAQGNAASRQARAARTRLRLELGISRPNSPRGHLKARVFAERERLAARAVAGGLDDPRLALALIREVDPAQSVEVSVGMPATLEDVDKLTPTQLLAFAAQLGLEPEPLPPWPATTS